MLFNCLNARMIFLRHFFIALYSVFYLLNFQATFSALWMIKTQIYTHFISFNIVTVVTGKIIYDRRWILWLDFQRCTILCILVIPFVLLAQIFFFKWIIKKKFFPCMWFLFYFFLFRWLLTSRTVGTGFQNGPIIQSSRVELGILDFKVNLLRFPNWKHIRKAVLWMEGSW